MVFWDFFGKEPIRQIKSSLFRKVFGKIVLSNLNCQFGSSILSLEIVILKLLWIFSINNSYWQIYEAWARPISGKLIQNREKYWMSYPEIRLCHTSGNWNFGKISGWVFQDLPIRDNTYRRIVITAGHRKSILGVSLTGIL